MAKKEIKEEIKNFKKTADEATSETKVLNVLNPIQKSYSKMDKSQKYIQNNVNLYTKEKAFNITLENGPFKCTYTSNGSHMLVTNETGCVSTFDTQSLNVGYEMDLKEQINCATWLHNELYSAIAQKDALFIYDNKGSELHAVRDMYDTRVMEFLPYHFLLAGVNNKNNLNYLDTSIGEIISSICINSYYPTSITSNPTNAVIYLGSPRGHITLWTPNQKTYAMQINCHKASVNDIKIDRTGTYIVSAGADSKVNIFDIRNSYKPITSIVVRGPSADIAISQKNLIAIGHRTKVSILKNLDELYMRYDCPGRISSIEFCPHEDILNIGHCKGFTNIVVPSSGDPVYDSSEISPFMSKTQRQNSEVKRLLEKIPADMISVESVLGQFKTEDKKEQKEETERFFAKQVFNRNALSRFTREI